MFSRIRLLFRAGPSVPTDTTPPRGSVSAGFPFLQLSCQGSPVISGQSTPGRADVHGLNLFDEREVNYYKCSNNIFWDTAENTGDLWPSYCFWEELLVASEYPSSESVRASEGSEMQTTCRKPSLSGMLSGTNAIDQNCLKIIFKSQIDQYDTERNCNCSKLPS